MKLSEMSPANIEAMGVLLDHLDKQSQSVSRAMERTANTLSNIDKRLAGMEAAFNRSKVSKAVDLFLYASAGAYEHRHGIGVIVIASALLASLAVGVAYAWPADSASFVLDRIQEISK